MKEFLLGAWDAVYKGQSDRCWQQSKWVPTSMNMVALMTKSLVTSSVTLKPETSRISTTKQMWNMRRIPLEGKWNLTPLEKRGQGCTSPQRRDKRRRWSEKDRQSRSSKRRTIWTTEASTPRWTACLTIIGATCGQMWNISSLCVNDARKVPDLKIPACLSTLSPHHRGLSRCGVWTSPLSPKLQRDTVA